MAEAAAEKVVPEQPSTPENPLKEKKDALWQKMHGELIQITDGLGKPPDSGIMETIVGLNVLGITTRQSCEGHTNWGTGAPWVDVEATGTHIAELEREALAAWEKATNLDREHAPEEELDKVFAEANQARRRVQVEHLRVAQHVVSLLDEFYKTRQVLFDQRLVMTYGATRLESQGAAFQTLADPELKQQKLLEYQDEMNAFTEFVKGKFYEDTTPVEPGQAVAQSLEEARLKWIAEHSKSNQIPSAPEQHPTNIPTEPV
jgi:hypothetical protein